MADMKLVRGPAEGALGRATATAYWLIVVGVLMLVAAAPGLMPVVLLENDPSNIPLVMLCLVPVGPAFGAAFFAFRRRETDDDLAPAAAFWRGYRVSVADVLRVWVPALVVLGIVGINFAFGSSAGLPTGMVIMMGVLAALIVTWAVNAVLIASLFSFRTRDVARLAAFYLVRKPLVALGTVSFVVLAGGIGYFASDWVLGLFGSLFALMIIKNHAPILRDLEFRFVAS